MSIPKVAHHAVVLPLYGIGDTKRAGATWRTSRHCNKTPPEENLSRT